MEPYLLDGRKPIAELYARYAGLERWGWVKEGIFEQRIPGIRSPLVAYGLRTPRAGPALWLISGIHGEEPAGPNALAENMEVFVHLQGMGIPIVLLPLCNPMGYLYNWRYPSLCRQNAAQEGLSVGSAEHYLPAPERPAEPRAAQPPSAEARALTASALETACPYPPLLVLDLHEDEYERFPKAYVYSQGERGTQDPVAQEIVALLCAEGFAVPQEGRTRFGEAIIRGVVGPVQDGSLDELLAARRVIAREGETRPGPAARSVIVVETPTSDTPLAPRVRAHGRILRHLERLWSMVR